MVTLLLHLRMYYFEFQAHEKVSLFVFEVLLLCHGNGLRPVIIALLIEIPVMKVIHFVFMCLKRKEANLDCLLK